MTIKQIRTDPNGLCYNYLQVIKHYFEGIKLSIAPTSKATGSKLGTYVRSTLLAVLGVGSAAGVTGGYLHLKNEIANNGTVLTRKLDESEAKRANLAQELEKANATIARLEAGMSENKTAIGETKEKLSGIDTSVKIHETQISELVKKSAEHEGKVTNLVKDLDSVKFKVGGLEQKVSISDLQDIYDKALASAAIIRMEVESEEDDGMGGKVKKTHIHQGSGVVVAHINGGKDGGYIATNWHVLSCGAMKEEDYKNKEITIILGNGSKVKATPHYYKGSGDKEEIARKKEHDLVLLKTTENMTGTTPVPFASEGPKTGEGVIIVGNPFGDTLGEKFSASFGIISGDSIVKYEGNPMIFTDNEKGAIKTTRTDAAMNPGNSGGLGYRVRDGRMVFMPTFIFPGEIFHGMGFGVPAYIIRDDIKTWIPYDPDAHGTFTERKLKPANGGPVGGEKATPSIKQSKIFRGDNDLLVRQSERKMYNAKVLATRRL